METAAPQPTPRRRRGDLEEIPFVAFDTETTGLGGSDRLVELGAVRFRGEMIEGEWSALVNPGVPIPAEATAVHGIRDADVKACPPAGAVLPSFLDFIEGAALVAHNAPFDVRVLVLELLRAGMVLPDNPVLDTCAIPRRLRLAVPNHRLGTLAGAFGVHQGRAHRALDDARVAKDLFRAYLKELGPPAEALIRYSLTQDGSLLSFRGFAGEPVLDTPLVSLIRRARVEGRALSLVYRGGSHPGSVRRVKPRDVYSFRETVYMEADSLEDGMLKTFRIDRITAAHLAETPRAELE
jgi:DNA polymerase III epsilon subunit family exonuclease